MCVPLDGTVSPVIAGLLGEGVPYRNFLTSWESDFLELSNFGSLGLAEQHRILICRRR
jgi:hypothetical protein